VRIFLITKELSSCVPWDGSYRDFIVPWDGSHRDLIVPWDISYRDFIVPWDCSYRDFTSFFRFAFTAAYSVQYGTTLDLNMKLD
jgi:hypothetical protein